MPRRILSLAMALLLCLLLLPTAALAAEVDFGKPQNLSIEVRTSWSYGAKKDIVTGIDVNFTHDPLFLEAAALKRANRDDLLYGYRVVARYRVDGGEWFEVGRNQTMNSFHFGGSTTARFNLVYFQPGFARPDREDRIFMTPALIDLSNLDKNTVEIDLENHLIEAQLCYELYNRDTEKSIQGEWTDIVAIGKGAEKEVPPEAFPTAPVISNIAVELDSNGDPVVSFDTQLPDDILAATTNTLGQVRLYAEIRYNDGAWQELFFRDAAQLQADTGREWFRMPQTVDGKDISIESTKIEVRVRAEWHAHPEKTYFDSSRPAEVESPWSGSLTIGVAPWSKASDWATPELEKANQMGLIPDVLKEADLTKPITRAEFAAVSVKVYEALSGTKALPAVTNPFTDTTDLEVLKAYNVGVTNGISPTEFSPNLLLNREQAATMLTRVFKRVTMPGWTLATDSQFKLTYTMPALFADDAQISDWAKDSVYFMNANGIINGLGNNKFGPRNTTSEEEAMGYANATREQALLIAVRMVENLGK